MNRHGLVAGATGTGKTKTLQVLAEQLSAPGVPVLVADVKGDVSGLAAPGGPGGPGEKRMADLGLPFAPDGVPGRVPRARRARARRAGARDGERLRAAAARQGAGRERDAGVRASRSSSTTRTARASRCSTSPTCARCSPSWTRTRASPSWRGSAGCRRPPSACCCARWSSLETGGGTEFFGEPQFDVADLLRTAPEGRGVISCVELAAVQDKPELWSTALHVARRRAVRGAARGGRPRPAQARRSSSTRRTCCSPTRPTRSSRRSRAPCG